ncbi:MAG: two-component sensor histidine kinase [Lachnospiraceae bacterium]|nr:two-component sensor histidine kinase [Lachnospiraceae bacterium]
MKDLGNKLLLFIASSGLLWLVGLTPLTSTVFVASLAVTSLCTRFQPSKIALSLLLGYNIAALILPELGIFLPLMLYDASRFRRKLTLPLTILAGLRTFLWLLPSLQFPWLILVLFSVPLSLFCQRIDKLRKQLHTLQDESRESTMVLEEQKYSLIEKQNYEIHLAILSERNRIAREIHDNVGHMLTRSLLQTGALKVINQDPSMEEPLSTLHDTLNTAMTNIRTSVHDLHDDSIDLAGVLRDIAAQTETAAIQVDYDMGMEVPRKIKYAFIAISKEALNNIQKHSNASAGQISAREQPGFYQLRIEDNGTVKLPPENTGIGLSNMRERVKELGGTIRFSTENGFCIYITIMKPAKEQREETTV